MITLALTLSVVALAGSGVAVWKSTQAVSVAAAAREESGAASATVEGLGITSSVLSALEDGLDIRNQPPT